MNKRMLIWLAAGVYGLTGAGMVNAAVKVPSYMVCGDTAEMEAALTSNGEALMAIASTGNEESPLTVQFWLNTSTKDWTVVYKSADEKSCMVGAGQNFRSAPRGGQKPGQGT